MIASFIIQKVIEGQWMQLGPTDLPGEAGQWLKPDGPGERFTYPSREAAESGMSALAEECLRLSPTEGAGVFDSAEIVEV